MAFCLILCLIYSHFFSYSIKLFSANEYSDVKRLRLPLLYICSYNDLLIDFQGSIVPVASISSSTNGPSLCLTCIEGDAPIISLVCSTNSSVTSIFPLKWMQRSELLSLICNNRSTTNDLNRHVKSRLSVVN